MAILKLLISDNLYLRDPQETELGRKIVEESIALIDTLGFEGFTFKKLANAIESTESSIYRYFENKHRLLNYLIAWYWNWVEYKIDFGIQNIDDPAQKLDVALRILTEKKQCDATFPQIDEEALYRIVITESDKVYHTKNVDSHNKEGLFRGLKSITTKVAGFVKSINPDFAYPHSLVSTVLQAAHHQVFYAQHIPSLTDCAVKEDCYVLNGHFIKQLVFKSISA